VLLSLGALSNLGTVSNIVGKVSFVTPTISLEEKETCTTKFFDVVEDVKDVGMNGCQEKSILILKSALNANPLIGTGQEKEENLKSLYS
jgi:hypothetical protein